MAKIYPGDKVWYKGTPFLVDGYAGNGLILLHDGEVVHSDDVIKDNDIGDQEIEDAYFE